MQKILRSAAWISLFLILAASFGCMGGPHVKEVQSNDVERHLRQSQGGNDDLTIPSPSRVDHGPGFDAPAFPVRRPARTLRIWVPPHQNEYGTANLGYWAVIVVEPERFDVPGYSEELSQAQGTVRPYVLRDKKGQEIEKQGAETKIHGNK